MKDKCVWIAVAWAMSAFAANSRAANAYTNSSSGNWSVSGSWNGPPPPAGGASNAAIFLQPSSGALVATNDLAGTLTLNQLSALANTVSLYGNTMLFTNTGATLPLVTNSSGNPFNLCTPTTLGANTTFGAGNDITQNGVLRGSGSLTKSGSGTLVLTSTNFYTGNTTVSGGKLRLVAPGSIYDTGYTATPTITINTGAVLEFDNWGYGSTLSFGDLDFGSSRFVVNGGTLRCVAASGTWAARGCNIGTAGGALDSAVANQLWTIAYQSSYPSLSLSGLMTLTGAGYGEIDKNISGTGGLTMNGAGTWTLRGTNTFSGPTTISTGTLALGGSGSMANTPIISVTNGASFDIGGLASAFTLQSGQILSNSAAATGSLKGSLNTGSGTVSISYTNGMPSLVIANGILMLSTGTVFQVNNTGPALALGGYKIISAGTGGAVAGTLPLATVSGGGLTSPGRSLAITNGELYLVVGSGPTNNPLVAPWTVNFDFNCTAGGVTPGTYNGLGAVGSGTFWNAIPGPPTYSAPYHSTSGLADNGSTDTGISVTLNASGYWAGASSNALLDDYATATSPYPQSFSFTNVPDGTYNLVLFGVDSLWDNLGGVFTVNATSLANFTANGLTLVANPAGGYPNFVQGDNYVTFPYLQVRGGSLTGYFGSTNTGSAQSCFNGAQFQCIGPLGLVAPSLNIASGATFDVLAVTGGSSYTFASGQTLQDYGTINGSIIIASGASLTLGTAAGFLNLNGSLTMSNGSTVAITISRAMATNSLVSGINTLTCSGTLTVNAQGTGYQVGDSFKLFEAAHYVGAFSNVTPSTPAPGLVWDVSQLGVGVLKVAAGPPQTALAAVFGDNMVLQQGKPAPVWGTADPGRTITVSFGGQNKTATTGLDGRWMVRLDAMPANATSQNLTVTGWSQLVRTNVVVGEVWLASGQSNMSFPMVASPPWTFGAINYSNEIAAANFPLIRFTTVWGSPSLTAVPDLSWPLGWQVCSSNSVGNFSAVAYFFGRQLWQNLNVPIGLITSAVGGTPAEAWTSQSALDAIPELKQMAAQELASYNEGALAAQSTPATLFNGMIQPLIPYALRGVIWYQGEANTGSAVQGNQYRVLFPTLIADWRAHWQQDNLSFDFVQLADYNWSFQPYVREAQALTLKTTTNTGMAVTIDIGDPINIHPQNKQDVGARLALWALTNDYGQNVVCSGPLFKSYAIETNRIRLFFDYADSGLMVGQKTGINPVVEVASDTLTCFEIAGNNGQYVTANAQIDGWTVVVSSASVPNPVVARYAWAGAPTNCNFYNRAGLPASPFRILVNTNPPVSLRMTLSNSVANLSVAVPGGLTYWMQSKDTLTAPTWTPWTIPQTASGSTVTVRAALNGRTQRFYRVAQVPP